MSRQMTSPGAYTIGRSMCPMSRMQSGGGGGFVDPFSYTEDPISNGGIYTATIGRYGTQDDIATDGADAFLTSSSSSTSGNVWFTANAASTEQSITLNGLGATGTLTTSEFSGWVRCNERSAFVGIGTANGYWCRVYWNNSQWAAQIFRVDEGGLTEIAAGSAGDIPASMTVSAIGNTITCNEISAVDTTYSGLVYGWGMMVTHSGGGMTLKTTDLSASASA